MTKKTIKAFAVLNSRNNIILYGPTLPFFHYVETALNQAAKDKNHRVIAVKVSYEF